MVMVKSKEDNLFWYAYYYYFSKRSIQKNSFRGDENMGEKSFKINAILHREIGNIYLYIYIFLQFGGIFGDGS